jgi:hypothetical protein
MVINILLDQVEQESSLKLQKKMMMKIDSIQFYTSKFE